ncbi:MAG TPA: phosphotransferase [Tetrasphaera sp.]|uniref:phosphotransferase n=1 Tax=Nostocoides sp. TaxID=1917966 RepID=UPI002C747C7C|nr:phosphotransferase [Tetrasphaera sp.]HNQ06482.1 phosphotransferase [Tetrasphaera sp.]
MHDDELVIETTTVRALVADQFPRWRHLPVTRLVTAGTVNAIFRLGASLTARLPLRPQDAVAAHDWLTAECAAQAELAEVSPVPAPRPVALGRPGIGYPMPFAIQTWVPGSVPRVGQYADSDQLADDLAALVLALRSAPTRGRRFRGDGRGGALTDHDDWVAECIRRNAPWFDPARTAALWGHLRELAREDPDVMNHGDLVPGNLLVGDGKLIGVLDGGGFGPADPALDLVAAWHVLDTPRRGRLRAAIASSDLEWERGRAWAFVQAVGLVHYYEKSNLGMYALGMRTIREVLGGP